MRLQRDDLESGKIVPLALQVETRQGLPVRVVWRGRRIRVTYAVALESVQGRWWLDWPSRGVRRRTFRVTLTDGRGSLFDAELTKDGAVWKLSKILD